MKRFPSDFSVFDVHSSEAFRAKAMELFHHQREHNAVYKAFIAHLKRDVSKIQQPEEIPFLPVEVFKTHTVATGSFAAELVFSSSTTTGQVPSLHHVADAALYEASFVRGFERFYGPPSDYTVLALLPGYLERSGSSLVHMVDALVKQSNDARSGFYLYEHAALAEVINALPHDRKVLLFGVTHALLDFADRYTLTHPLLTVLETGGMKGRREELTREAVHARLRSAFNGASVHSEYGMTELLSQAYADDDRRFECPPWMQVFIRETDDPFAICSTGKTGRIQVIDLANQHSCAFLATGDLGRMFDDNRFEVLGRFDHAEVRGCSLMLES